MEHEILALATPLNSLNQLDQQDPLNFISETSLLYFDKYFDTNALSLLIISIVFQCKAIIKGRNYAKNQILMYLPWLCDYLDKSPETVINDQALCD